MMEIFWLNVQNVIQNTNQDIYFMDIDFDTWKPDTQSCDRVCSVCGVKSSTPHQNIRLRQKAYEERIVV